MRTSKFPFIGMMYGVSNTAKSSQIARLIEDNFRKTGKKARLLTFDDGGTSAYDYLAEAGILDLWDFSVPKEGADPASWAGVSASAWLQHAANNQWFKLDKGRVAIIPNASKDPDYNMLFIEGIDSSAVKTGGKWIKDGTKVGMEIVAALQTAGFGGQSFTGGNLGMAHYMALQNVFTIHVLPNLRSLDYDVCLFTTHEAVGEDKNGLDGKVYGPSIAGKALTSKLAEKIPVLLHFERMGVKDKAAAGGIAQDYRAYFVPHQDLGAPLDPKAVWPANSRIPAHMAPALLQFYPGGYVPLTFTEGLPAFIQTWRSLNEQAAIALAPPSRSASSTTPVAK